MHSDLSELKMSTDIRDRETMYKMIIGQLFYDGHQSVAVSLSKDMGMASNPPPPSDKLFRYFTIAKQVSDTEDREREALGMNETATHSGLDLEYDADPSLYETIFLTTHKQPCTAAAFNSEGSLVATAGADCAIKIMDVERMLMREIGPPEMAGPDLTTGIDPHHPNIRTLYDHIDTVNCLAFHPREQILASGANDFTLKLFDFSKSAVKRAFRTLFEVEPIRCLSFHPTGDYILVGTQHPTLRLYDVPTGQAFVSPVPTDQHRGSISDVNYAENGRLYVTASKDGDVKVWDGVSNRCVQTFLRAHDGFEVCSASFTKNAKYVLTAGMDSVVKLWELVANRCLIAYTGAGATGPMEKHMRAVFNHSEDYVLFPDEKSGSLCSWDARNADRKRLLALGHVGPITYVSHSPTQPAFVTCSEDNRARFWYKKTSVA